MIRATPLLLLLASAALAEPLACDLSGYKAAPGLSAVADDGLLRLEWAGARGQDLRAVFGLDNGVPIVRELAVRKTAWTTLAHDLTPEFHTVSGVRRISTQQLTPLSKLNMTSDEIVEREKWKVFWDAPLVVPGSPGTNPGLPRSEKEIERASASFRAASCSVRTNGVRLEVTFPGLTMGSFSGFLQFTVFRGANLLRQEAVAQTAKPSVAYKYSGGLKGFRIDEAPRLHWQDVARAWQKYEFGGSPNTDPVALRARHRIASLETTGGSLAVFPAPHKFFFGREIELNLGYVYYRKDDASTYAIGVRQAEREEMYRPYGYSDELWNKRMRQSRSFALGNFALFNAPPGTWQRMPVYFYLSAEPPRAAHQAVLTFTHNDSYKPLPGYQVGVSHFHTHFHEQLLDAGTLDLQPPWVPTFRALGINIAMMSDFHGDGHAQDSGPLRFKEQRAYFEGSRRHSDKDFLIMPGEEPNAHFGGHYTTVFPRPVYWTLVRNPEQSFVEQHPDYGKVYHVQNAQEELEMLRLENGYVWQAHPRTKGSSGYPDTIRETPHFQSDRYLGASFQSLPADLSQSRLCEVRCLGTLDDMNNWAAAKYLVAEGDTYAKYPDDETYPHLMVNYIQVPRLPAFDEDWSPITQAMRAGRFFVTSGEVLIRSVSVEGKTAVNADVEWTFPLEFVEVVWGDGRQTARKIVSATDKLPHSASRFRIPIDLQGKKWVRFAAWDSAGNGAISQPIHLR
jgi:hypothetical protein